MNIASLAHFHDRIPQRNPGFVGELESVGILGGVLLGAYFVFTHLPAKTTEKAVSVVTMPVGGGASIGPVTVDPNPLSFNLGQNPSATGVDNPFFSDVHIIPGSPIDNVQKSGVGDIFGGIFSAWGRGCLPGMPCP